MYQLARMFAEAGSPAQYVGAYFTRMAELMRQIDHEQLGRVIEHVNGAIEGGRNIFLIANGGSSAIAGHFVNDVIAGAAVEGRPPIRALSLTDNVATVTALANDVGFEHIFDLQLRELMRPGDLLIAMSVSGNSQNILNGVEQARRIGGSTIGWCGFGGGKLADLCDLVVHIPTTPDEYGPVEDFFSLFEHIVTGYLAQQRGRQLHH